ncbi:YiiD C-terminal domain-containing protein [Stenotrophomonas sp. HITSZ_GD]|uniref:YiiD C-terminal domain-containing protein n=1 Tax=Stenotrophomonas sp. HITSZ_GD TaxID=3037248 RepID=UPI00240CFF08|nr:YiiD C-terminal domain-containing protein [Stenotrophomonas sp. HITSZ_GD]MDG2523922.1 YiiD C-terminal domain-containing protein [Stenotrophomonas sp. HITSZ_GD]
MPLPAPSADDLRHLQAYLSAMPPVAAMGIRVERYEDGALFLQAPLAANVNDKDNAFGGSLASLLTLAGWGWVSLQLRLAGLAADVYVADSQLRYLKPVYETLRADAAPALVEERDAFLATLRQRGKARLGMAGQVRLASGEVAATFAGRFVAIAKG